MGVQLQCTCGKIMDMVQQDETDGNKTKLKYVCDCGNKGLVLYYPDRAADFFIKDPNGNTLKYDQLEEED